MLRHFVSSSGLTYFLQRKDRRRGWHSGMHASFHCIYCMLRTYSIYCYVYVHRWYVKCVYCIYFCMKFLNTLVLHWKHEFISVSAWRSKRHSPKGPVHQLAKRRGPSLPPAWLDLGNGPASRARELSGTQSWWTARVPSGVRAEQRGHTLLTPLPSEVSFLDSCR